MRFLENCCCDLLPRRRFDALARERSQTILHRSGPHLLKLTAKARRSLRRQSVRHSLLSVSLNLQTGSKGGSRDLFLAYPDRICCRFATGCLEYPSHETTNRFSLRFDYWWRGNVVSAEAQSG